MLHTTLHEQRINDIMWRTGLAWTGQVPTPPSVAFQVPFVSDTWMKLVPCWAKSLLGIVASGQLGNWGIGEGGIGTWC